jgi:hypothetical protein
MMVTPYDDERLLLTLQIDHSRVAGFLASHWGNEVFARLRPYASMVIAAQEHDCGWWDWEIKPSINDEGYPLDYIGSVGALGPVWLDFYRHGVERVALQDPYAAYYVSMHGDGLTTQGMGLLGYMPDYASLDPRAQKFVDEQHEIRSRLLAELRAQDRYRDVTTDEYLWTNYKYMEVFDQMAQFLCNRYPLNSAERKNGPTNQLSGVPVPVAPGVEDTNLLVDVIDESRAIVRPYPFDTDPLPITFQGRVVPKRRFESQDAFLEEFYAAPPVTVSYSLHAD